MGADRGWVTEYVQVEGRSVYYRRSVGGSGVPVVHIHGFAISGAYLMPTARLLADRWVNVVPDLPGYGRSERRDYVLDVPALAGALLAVLDALDIDRAVLVGNSMGCPIGLEVAHAHQNASTDLCWSLPLGAFRTSHCPARSASWRWT